MLKTLSFIGDRLKNKNIIWGVGGSLLLSFYKIIDKPNDIDILVDETNATKLNEIMSSIGKAKEALSSHPFRTMNFSKYRINGIDIDVMGGFAIQHDEGIYKISLQQESIVTHKKINGVDIPLCSLEDWYILYWLIPNKQEKALLIENFLRTNGIIYPQLLEKALKQSLPLEVKERVEKLLN
ncbi:hypothetical protein GI584_18790 [Gracilibacillus salitolerans]|uniref:Nucleotidyl transferase AbiEii/AbiGii toxin family protein n=1 Tax=Gracilibacillus salitolerans TaxID=2663022 RepID=A0A5Q2TPK1_9BACI|nr:hypothetical protein [Gracilibacillus salitolerans]QGH35973.1 hypothetical protein GI584_18790 [Gracilibacillus salitolerans]